MYSPRQCEGFGLSDGEVMERLWSYLRRFSRMTKEMRPAHRVDILAHALLYYAFMSKQKLGILYFHGLHTIYVISVNLYLQPDSWYNGGKKQRR